MGDVPYPEENEEEARALTAQRIVRSAVAGHPMGSVRRILLYIIVAVALFADGLGGTIVGGAGLIALLLLAMSDQLA